MENITYFSLVLVVMVIAWAVTNYATVLDGPPLTNYGEFESRSCRTIDAIKLHSRIYGS